MRKLEPQPGNPAEAATAGCPSPLRHEPGHVERATPLIVQRRIGKGNACNFAEDRLQVEAVALKAYEGWRGAKSEWCLLRYLWQMTLCKIIFSNVHTALLKMPLDIACPFFPAHRKPQLDQQLSEIAAMLDAELAADVGCRYNSLYHTPFLFFMPLLGKSFSQDTVVTLARALGGSRVARLL